ncbi:T9SS type A sorting domain-containing protein [Rubrivirga marina]|uniref:Secretion system C-terminal sorting domain-containing protein n=1 Tax=Rubrivirga marina TaxID=1196024 RepID=A0A271J160_9BACT|nr:T9SS type A sorting domain-containing protein [Rubrivirga marina]PAP77261.1 hypothetical protein BSZ37_12865 [Rubrivirga marina]
MVARWDGSTWTSLGGANDWIFALGIGPDGTLYAAGRFTQIGGVAATRVARYDGTSWAAMGPGFNNPPEDLVVDSEGTVYVTGGMNLVGGGSPRAIFQWDGQAWTVPGGGQGLNNTGYSLALDAEDNLYVGGSFRTVSGVAANNVAKWDGTSWSALGGGTQTVGAVVYTLEVGPTGELYAGGYFTEMDGGTVEHLARWDGSAWAGVAGGVAGESGAGTAVRDVAFDGGGQLYIGGSFATAGGVAVMGVARLAGATWEPLAGGVGNGTVLAIAVDGAAFYAGGGYSSIGGVSGLNYFARYEGGVATPAEPVPQAGALVLGPAFPNPSIATTTLRFSSDRAQTVRLELFDVLGRRVATLYEGPVSAGQRVAVPVAVGSLPAGAYLARLTGDGGPVTRRLDRAR